MTSKPDNLLYFTSGDAEFTSPVSKLMLDLGYIEKLEIKRLKPKIGHLLITKRRAAPGNLKIITAILTQSYLDNPDLNTLKGIFKNLATLVKSYDTQQRDP